MFSVTYTTPKGRAEAVSVPTLIEAIDTLNVLARAGCRGFATAGNRIVYDNAASLKVYGYETRS